MILVVIDVLSLGLDTDLSTGLTPIRTHVGRVILEVVAHMSNYSVINHGGDDQSTLFAPHPSFYGLFGRGVIRCGNLHVTFLKGEQ